MPCLLDIDTTHTVPASLTDSNLFILQAASPDPVNTKWTKQRTGTVTFVLNPPDEDEIIKASVFYSLFLHL